MRWGQDRASCGGDVGGSGWADAASINGAMASTAPATSLANHSFSWSILSLSHDRRRSGALMSRESVVWLAEQRDELAPPDHSSTSSARRWNDGGNVSPSDFAVLRLIASSNVVGCNTGSSAGLAPLTICPA